MIFTASVLFSFLVYLVIGFLVSRKVKDESDYFVAGRNAPTLLVTGSLVASYLTTSAFNTGGRVGPEEVKTTLGFTYVAVASCVFVVVALIVVYLILYSQAIASDG